MTILEFQKNLKKINLIKAYKECMKELEPEIIDLNLSQLEVGKDSSGSLLPEYANADYAAAKKAQGSKSGNHYDLKLEGDFWEAFFGKLEGEDMRIESRDIKRDELVALTSIEIFGLTKENLNKFINDSFYPLFMDKLRKQLRLN